MYLTKYVELDQNNQENVQYLCKFLSKYVMFMLEPFDQLTWNDPFKNKSTPELYSFVLDSLLCNILTDF